MADPNSVQHAFGRGGSRRDVSLVALGVSRTQAQAFHDSVDSEPYRALAGAVKVRGVAAPTIALKTLPTDVDEPGPCGVDVDVGAGDLEIAAVLGIDGNGFVAALKEMPAQLVPVIEALGVGAV